ncbi:LLM class flavin-dependent oxidoreductase [Mucilaginibacter kameinonensis]|uniref:LLM class flavin-dependent oxidoreductase n=1 Tax=Mucilaginibacter kameinonensis TaxID=452286 RepID=UPI0021D04A1A|nr:LLM class flavin-dependent oxidoreductase [Mucilaginibacter kameinonensis]
MESVASSATSLLIGHVAGKTATIRVGSGGIMLPNHSPLVVAEQFGTLETLYPGLMTSDWAGHRAVTRQQRWPYVARI